MIIYYHPRFEKSYKQLDQKIKDQAEKRVKIFRLNCFDKSLNTHYLHGKLKKFCSFSVNSRCRILFEFVENKKNEVIFLDDIGYHDIYR